MCVKLTRGGCKVLDVSCTCLVDVVLEDVCKLPEELDCELQCFLSLKNIYVRGM